MKKYFVLNSYQKDFIGKYWQAYFIIFIAAAVSACFGFSLSPGYNFMILFLYVIALLLELSVVANFDYSNIGNPKIVDDIFQHLCKNIEFSKINAYVNIILFVLPWLFSWFEFLENLILNFSGCIFIYSIFICIGSNIGIFTLRNRIIHRIYEEKQMQTEKYNDNF